jgi:FHA domain
MHLSLKIISGPLQGRIYPIRDGAVIGRADVDISLSDAKVSGRHAKIEKGPAKEFVLIDLGSTNGIRVKGQRLAQVTLSPGLILKIGNTACEVLRSDDSISDETLPPLEEIAIPPLPPPAPIKKAKTWREYLTQFTARAKEKVKNRANTILPFDPLLILTIQRGLQSGTEWTLGFGPRNIGAAGLDLPLFEPSAPPLAFSVEPSGRAAKFVTKHPDKVRLNGKSVSAEVLKAGDMIYVSDTIIKVSYKE